VIGYCHLRQDYRQFRADRMHDIRLTDKFQTKKHGELEEYRKTAHQDIVRTKVVIEVKKEANRYIKDRARYFGLLEEKDKGEVVEMTFQSQDLMDGFSRWFLMFGDKAKVIDPPEVKTRIKELLSRIESNL
jgi:predicted DNA-binding transcriptional regulator YafY